MKKIIVALFILALCLPCSAIELERQRNVASVIMFPLIDSANTLLLKSGAGNPDSESDQFSDSGDNPDGFADLTNEAVEVGATGQYYLVLTAGELNHPYVTIQVKSDDAITQTILIRTMVGDPLNIATSDDGSTINVTGGAIDTVTTTGTATVTGTVNGLAANVITAASINASAIGADEIATNAIGADEIAASAITASELATDCITTDELATGAIDADSIAASAIGASEIANSAIDAATYAANAITDAAVANDVQVDVVTIETVDATDQLDTACATVTVTAFAANVIDAAATAADFLAEINGEVLDVIAVDTYDETDVTGGPPEEPTIAQMLNYLYRIRFQKRLVTVVLDTIRNFDDDGTLFDAVLDDDGATFTQNRFIDP